MKETFIGYYPQDGINTDVSIKRISSGFYSVSQKPFLQSWILVSLCALLFMCSQFYRVANAIIAPELQRELLLSSEQLGILSAAFFYAFALAQLPLGFCLDRMGPRLTMTIFSLIGSLGAWLFAAATGLGWATSGRALLGLGMAANLMGPMKLFTQWFSRSNFAILNGLMLALGTVGNMLAATPLALLVNALGWRWSFRIIGCLTAVITLVFFTLVSDRPERTKEHFSNSGKDRNTLSIARIARILLTRREYWLISLGNFMRYGSFVAIQGLWAGPYLMEVLNYSPVEAGNFLLLLNFGLIVGSPFGGWLSDRILCSRKWVVIIGMAGLALAELGLALGWGVERIWVLCGLFFVLGASSSFGIVSYAHIKEVMPEEMSGAALTGVNFFLMLGAAVFLQGMGKVLDLWAGTNGLGVNAYRIAFFLAFLGVASAFVLYLFTRDTHLEREELKKELKIRN